MYKLKLAYSWEIFKKTWKKTNDDDCRLMASDITYNLLFSLFPALIFFASLLAFLGDKPRTMLKILDVWSELFPPQIFNTVTAYAKSITRLKSLGGITFGLVFCLWGSSNAIFSIIQGMDRAYGVPRRRRFWTTRLATIILVVLIGIVIIYSFNFFVTIQKNYQALVSKTYFEKTFGLFFSFLEIPISIFFVFGAAVVIYYFAPHVKHRLRHVLPGAVYFTVCWWVLLVAFNLYLSNFNSFNVIYGALGTVIILLIWIYVNSLLLLVGGELNSVLFADHIQPRIRNEK